jgi:glycine dehydrogenase subunit 1
MTTYSPHTDRDRRAMMEAIGIASVDELFEVVPRHLRYPPLNLPGGLSEAEVMAHLRQVASLNANSYDHPTFLGAGAYFHFIPSVVPYLAGRSEFATAYTPYQAEASQGTLQSIYEFQSLVCDLFDMDVANASLYDGATAVAEAVVMARHATGRIRALVPDCMNPDYRRVLRTYVSGQGIEVVEAPVERLADTVDDGTACVVVQQPDFFGRIHKLRPLVQAAHSVGALFVASVYPISLGLLRPPGAYGADIAVGEGQCLGNPLSFGGPYVGLFTCRKEHVRFMPGRVAGATLDMEGKRGFVLTLQTREQHIRRERATSNICTNEALNALMVTIYLAVMGKEGMRRVAELNYHKAHYAAARIGQLSGFSLPFSQSPFFNEFVVKMPVAPDVVNQRLFDEEGIIGGYDLGRDYPELEGCMLLCVTEMNSKGQIDVLVDALARVAR